MSRYKMIVKSIGIFRWAILLLPLLFSSCNKEEKERLKTSIELVADKEQAKANGKDEVTFSIKSLDPTAVEQAEIYYTNDRSQTAVKLPNRRFSTHQPGKYTFYALYGEKVKSAELPINFSQSELQLICPKTAVKADGKDQAVFSVLQDGEELLSGYEILVSADNGNQYEKMEGKAFCTNTAGEYLFVARYNDIQSKPTKITAQNTLLTLSVSKTSVIANGRNKVVFTIEEEGVVVTDYLLFLKKGEQEEFTQLSGHEYLLSEPGTYVFKAQKGSNSSNQVVVNAQPSVLILSGNKTSVIANGKNKVAFSLKEDGTSTTDYILYHKRGEQGEFIRLSNKEYTFSEPGKHHFKAQKGNYFSNQLTVEAQPSLLSLRVNKESITADGMEEATFSVYQDGEKLTSGYQLQVKAPSSASFVEYKGDKFKTKEAGRYLFIAEKGKLRSLLVSIQAKKKIEEHPILTADKTTLVADGKDQVVFSVTSNGVDVTTAYNIYRIGILGSEVPISGKTFSTREEGVHKFFAEQKTATDGTKKRSPLLTVQAERAMGDELNGRVFVHGVTPTSGWHDVNKFFGPRDSQGRGGDGVLCWAATASNLIQWWLEDYQRKGYTIPQGTPFGPGKIYELAVFEEFMKHWKNVQGSASAGVQFFFVEPDLRNQSTLANLISKDFVGFFKRSPQWKSVEPFFSTYGKKDSYVEEYDSYSYWRYKEGATTFTQIIVKLLKEGAVGLCVGNHEVTVWGIDLKNGLADYIYITNSDDRQHRLHRIKLEIRGNDVYLSEKIDGAAGHPRNGEGKRIDYLVGLRAYPAR